MPRNGHREFSVAVILQLNVRRNPTVSLASTDDGEDRTAQGEEGEENGSRLRHRYHNHAVHVLAGVFWLKQAERARGKTFW